jgi:hypothetical protein
MMKGTLGMAEQRYDATSIATRALRKIAALNLAMGVIGAVVILVDTGTRPSGYGISETNPSGVFLGFAILLGGVTICAVLVAIADGIESVFKIEDAVKPKEPDRFPFAAKE